MDALRVVVADDEALIAMDIAEMLTEAGYEVVGVANDGREACRLGETLRPDIFVLDIRMPKLDGIRAAKQIRERGLGPVVLLTAYSEESLVQQAGESGVFAYLLKPVNEASLVATLRIALARWQEQRETERDSERKSAELAARKQIERAKGLVAARYGTTEEEAYAKLRKIAMKNGLRLEAVAEQVIAQLGKNKERK